VGLVDKPQGHGENRRSAGEEKVDDATKVAERGAARLTPDD